MKSFLKKSGFTLIELIVVVAIIAILAAATLVAVNPARRVGNAQNAQRWTDINAIADAWSAYLADNNSTPPTTTNAESTTLENTTYAISTSTEAINGGTHSNAHCTGVTTTQAMLNLKALVTGGYVGKIPHDPSYTYAGNNDHTKYYLFWSSNGTVTVGACTTYNSAVIKVTR